jgi:16S rRNA (guanine1516-N2)-methyltransferase
MAKQSAAFVVVSESGDPARDEHSKQLAQRLGVQQVGLGDAIRKPLMLAVRDEGIELREAGMKPGHGFMVDLTRLDLRTGSGGLSRKQPIAKAFGSKVRSIVDATAGTGQDAALLAALGYDVIAIERSPVLHAMLEDGLAKAMKDEGFQRAIGGRLRLVEGDSRNVLAAMTPLPDAVYIDPMYPPKKRASALPRKEIQMLRKLVGDDPDAAELFATARQTAQQRVVVKRPMHAPSLGEVPSLCFEGKLVRYDVYVL